MDPISKLEYQYPTLYFSREFNFQFPIITLIYYTDFHKCLHLLNGFTRPLETWINYVKLNFIMFTFCFLLTFNKFKFIFYAIFTYDYRFFISNLKNSHISRISQRVTLGITYNMYYNNLVYIIKLQTFCFL